METSGYLVVLAILAYVGTAAVVVVYPSIGFGLLISIHILKVVFRRVIPGLLIGYTYDIAVVLLAILGGLVIRMRRGRDLPFTVPGAVMLCWLVIVVLVWVRLPGSHDFEYGFKKAVIFSVFNTLACLTVPLFMLSARDARRVLRIIFWTGVATAVAVPLFGETLYRIAGARVRLGGASPLVVADLCAYAVIIVICNWLAQRKNRQLMLGILVVPAAVYAIILTGTRGPILMLIVLLPVMLWMYRRSINFASSLMGLAAAGLVAVSVVTVLKPDMLVRFGSESIQEGTAVRMYMLRVTFRGMLANPLFGNGTGDTRYQLEEAGAGVVYPHNHVLEIANELGLLALAAYVLLVAYALRGGWQLNRPEWTRTEAQLVGVPVFICFLLELGLVMKSGSYAGNYMFYFFLVATVVLDQLRRSELREWRRSFWVGAQEGRPHSQTSDALSTR